MPIVVSIAKSQADFFRLIRLREEVFVLEQQIPLEIELDDDDDRAIHLIAREGIEVVGTARLVVNGSTGKIGRMAVKRAFRRQQVGHALMRALMRLAQEQGLTRLILHAQEHAVPFYLKMGFQLEGMPFDEGGVPHRKMVKDVRDTG